MLLWSSMGFYLVVSVIAQMLIWSSMGFYLVVCTLEGLHVTRSRYIHQVTAAALYNLRVSDYKTYTGSLRSDEERDDFKSWCSINLTQRRKEMFYLTTHSTHFIYGYMASDIW